MGEKLLLIQDPLQNEGKSSTHKDIFACLTETMSQQIVAVSKSLELEVFICL